ncbi:MAG: FecR domain-containing protein [Verrucomicrobia bacterium]|nr:FecR domain-containing protein [Verrucomicrobiota bacterium]
MNLSDKIRVELNELCSGLVDGTLTEPQRRRLEQLLAASPEARRVYVRALSLSASLFDYASEMQTEAPERSQRPNYLVAVRPWRWAIGALGAAAAIALAFWLGGLAKSGSGGEIQPQEIVAHLSGAKNCQWTGAAFPPGAQLQSGQRIELAAGFAEISFDSGALLVLEGPASLVVNSAWEAVLRRGVLKASVPQEAIGFRVSNAEVDVVDLGTEFSMVAEENGATEVFVLRGAVEAHPRSAVNSPARSSLVLREKQARRFERNQVAEVRNREQKLQRFVRKISLDRVVQPSAFVHWPFNEASGDRAAADSAGTIADNNRFDARLASSSSSELTSAHVDGRWDRALNCDGQLAATALVPPFAQRTPRTVAFWIKVPPDASVAESEPILAWAPASGGDHLEFAWNRAPNQGAFGALRTSAGPAFIIGTTPLRDGQWHHVAIVFSHSVRGPLKIQIKQYVDGRLDRVSAKHFAKRKAKEVGAETTVASNGEGTLSIGRRSNERGKAGFRGAIDELFIVGRALSQREIRMLMMQNRLPTPDTFAGN